jgi:protein ImuA
VFSERSDEKIFPKAFGFRKGVIVASRLHNASRIGELERVGALAKGLQGATFLADRIVPTGLAALDAILPGGGVPCGYVTEFAGAPSCGKLGLATSLLVSTLGMGERAAFVDAGRAFFPALSPGLVRSLAGLLVCRVGGIADGVAAADLLAESGVFEVVVVDLVVRSGASGSVVRTALARLERAARRGGTATVVVTEPPRGSATFVGGCAALRLEIAPGRGRWGGLAESRVRVGRSRFGTTGTTTVVQRPA